MTAEKVIYVFDSESHFIEKIEAVIEYHERIAHYWVRYMDGQYIVHPFFVGDGKFIWTLKIPNIPEPPKSLMTIGWVGAPQKFKVKS